MCDLDLQLLRWPTPWPRDMRAAMLGAMYATRIGGRAVAFSLAAFREAAGGRDLGDEDMVLIAGPRVRYTPRH